MTYHVEVERVATKAMQRFPRADRKRLTDAIEALGDEPRPYGVKKLTGMNGFRIRVGSYRVVYTIDDTIRIVTVTRIAHRTGLREVSGVAQMIPISEANGRLSELVREADSQDVLLMRHGRAAAVMMSPRRHDALVEELEDALDRLSVYEREGLTMSIDKVKAELDAE